MTPPPPPLHGDHPFVFRVSYGAELQIVSIDFREAAPASASVSASASTSPSPSLSVGAVLPSATQSPSPQPDGPSEPIAGEVVLSSGDGLSLGWALSGDNSTASMTVTIDKLAW
jgi:hypothetical protein